LTRRSAVSYTSANGVFFFREVAMKRVIAAAALVVALLAVTAAPATAATPSPKRMAAQIRTLQKQVKTLRKQVKQLQTIANVEAALVLCSDAATADALQGTWTTIERHEGTGTTMFGAQSPVNDLQACQALGIRRATMQPTVSALQSIINLFA
jgi:hypothetical protein